jgi:lysophospholipase L1-like esterase
MSFIQIITPPLHHFSAGFDELGVVIGGAYFIALGMGNLIEIVLNSRSGQAEKAPACLIVCPPPIAENFDSSEWAGQGIGALEKSKQLAPNYAKIAASLGVAFFDASTVIESSPVDSVHLSADAHATLGQALAQVVSGLPL